MRFFDPMSTVLALSSNVPFMESRIEVSNEWLLFGEYAIYKGFCAMPNYTLGGMKLWTDVIYHIRDYFNSGSFATSPVTPVALPSLMERLRFIIIRTYDGWVIFKRNRDNTFENEPLLTGNNLKEFWYCFINYHRKQIENSSELSLRFANDVFLSDILMFAFIFLVKGYGKLSLQLLEGTKDWDHHLFKGTGIVDETMGRFVDVDNPGLVEVILCLCKLFAGCEYIVLNNSFLHPSGFLVQVWNYGSAGEAQASEVIHFILQNRGLAESDPGKFWKEFAFSYADGAKLPSAL